VRVRIRQRRSCGPDVATVAGEDDLPATRVHVTFAAWW
jgi:hypothetical protein